MRLGTVGLVASMFKVLYMHKKGNVIEMHILTITHGLYMKSIIEKKNTIVTTDLEYLQKRGQFFASAFK